MIPGTTPPPDPAYEFPAPALWPFRTQVAADDWLATAADEHSPYAG